MRMLGTKASLNQHRLQMLYTAARLKAHHDPQIQALGETLLQKLQDIRALEGRAQALEEEEILARALFDARDVDRDTTILRMGSFVKATAPHLYDQLFPKRPSEIARAAYAQETKDIEAVTIRLEALPADHIVRQTYLPELQSDASDFQKAEEAKNAAEQSWLAFRMQSLQGKLAADEARYHIHADAAKLLPKAEVDDLFSTLKRSGM